VTVAWKPKADDKSVSPNKDDVKTASPKKEGRPQAATAPQPAARETGKMKQPVEVSEKPRGAKKDGILSLVESAFAKFESAPAPAAAPRGAKRSGEHEYSVAELLRLRLKTPRLRELPYRVLAAKTDGELLEVPAREPARRAEKPVEQQKPVSRADKAPAAAAAQNGPPKREKLGGAPAAQPAAQRKPAEKASSLSWKPASSAFVWKPKAA
jgi:hypothetical protein